MEQSPRSSRGIFILLSVVHIIVLTLLFILFSGYIALKKAGSPASNERHEVVGK